MCADGVHQSEWVCGSRWSATDSPVLPAPPDFSPLSAWSTSPKWRRREATSRRSDCSSARMCVSSYMMSSEFMFQGSHMHPALAMQFSSV